MAEHPNIMFYKYSDTEEALFCTVDLSKRVRGRQRSVSNIQFDALYPDGRAIAKPKLLDLKSLLPQSSMLFTNVCRVRIMRMMAKFGQMLESDNDDDSDDVQRLSITGCL